MKTLKTRAYMMAAMASAIMMDPVTNNRTSGPEVNAGGGDDALKRYRESKGIQEFTIDGVTVYARNYKNALRKAKNLYA